MDREEPDRIDHYDVIGRLGTGAAAEIYRAVDRRDGRVVALKVPGSSLMTNHELIRRFRREVAVTARLDHPLVQRSVDDRSHRSRPYLVLELLEGVNLRTEMSTRSTCTEEEARRWLADVAEALDHVHSRGVVHGDVKPENLIVGPDGRARLIDFGDATERRRRPRRWTLMTGLQGTPDYLAPEVILGRGVGPASDLYALGVIAFELLTGAPPFVGDDPESILAAHLEAAVPPILADRVDVSDGTVELVHDLLRRVPEDRPASAREVLDRLDRPTHSDSGPAPSRLVVTDRRLRGSATSAARRQVAAAVASITFAFIAIVTAVITASVLFR